MLETYKSLREVANYYQGGKEDIKIVQAYSYAENNSWEQETIIAYVYCKYWKVANKQVTGYYNVSDDDKASLLLSIIPKCLNEYDPNKAGLARMIVNYFFRAVRALSQHYDKASLAPIMKNDGLESLTASDVRQSSEEGAHFKITANTGKDRVVEDKYNLSELVQSLVEMNLTDKQLRYCKLVMSGDYKNDSDIAHTLGVSRAAICSMKRVLKEKLSYLNFAC